MDRFSRMRKPTLLKQIKDFQLPILSPENIPVAKLKVLVADHIKTYLEDWFLRRIKIDLLPKYNLLEPGRNKRHLPNCNLEFDFSWRSLKIAVEIQGGIDSHNRQSGHLSRSGIRNDMRKVCLCSLHGWMLFQFAPEHIKDEYEWHHYTLPLLETAIRIRRDR